MTQTPTAAVQAGLSDDCKIDTDHSVSVVTLIAHAMGMPMLDSEEAVSTIFLIR